MQPIYSLGDVVQLDGVSDYDHYFCTIMGAFNEEKERYPVRICDANKKFFVKPSKLKQIPPEVQHALDVKRDEGYFENYDPDSIEYHHRVESVLRECKPISIRLRAQLAAKIAPDSCSNGIWLPQSVRGGVRDENCLFSITTSQSITCFASVMEYTAPPGFVTMPSHMFRRLGISPGSDVIVADEHHQDFGQKEIPMGERVVFRAVSAAWEKIPRIECEAVLSFTMRKYRVVSVGQRIPIWYCDFYSVLDVVDVQPPAGTVRIHDDVRYGVIEMSADDGKIAADGGSMEVDSKITVGSIVYRKGDPCEVMNIDYLIDPPALNLKRLSDGQSIGSELSRVSMEHPTAFVEWKRINNGDDMLYELATNEDMYFCFRVEDDGSVDETADIVLSIFCQTGDADLYVIGSDVCGSSLWTVPSPSRYEWRATEVGSCQVSIPFESVARCNGQYLVNVHAYQGDVVFTLSVSRSEVGVDTEEDVVVDMEETEMKPCPDCGENVPIEAQEKHVDVVHDYVGCACGEYMEPDPLQEHFASCPFQLARCSFCPMKIAKHARQEHEALCMMMTSKCGVCGVGLPRRDMVEHLVSAHDRMEADVSFRDWLEASH